MAHLVDWKKKRSRKELAAIEQLESLGAVSKPFDVKAIGFDGIVIRFDEDQQTAAGLITETAAEAIRVLKNALLELRQTKLGKSDLKQIKTLKRLSGLDLSATTGVRIDTNQIAHLARLQLLELSSLPLTDHDLKPLVRLKKLRSLSLMETRITDGAIETIAAFRDLKEIYLARSGMTERGIDHLKRIAPGCRVIF